MALAEPPVGPSEQQSWQRLKARSTRSSVRFPLPAVAAALVLAAIALWFQRPRPELALSPEPFERRAQASPPSVVEPTAIASSASSAPVAQPKAPLRVKGPAETAGATASVEAAACAKLAKSADYAAATACYGRVARGAGMTSELALYEKARLEARALGNRTLALATLDEHRRRFPGGVLTSEVAVTRIDLLLQLGKRREALAAIDQSLPSTLGRERAADLQLMRAGLLASSGDCVAALQAVNAARQAGAHPSRLETIEQRCAGTGTTPAPEAR